jgi:hypothetical protein
MKDRNVKQVMVREGTSGTGRIREESRLSMGGALSLVYEDGTLKPVNHFKKRGGE